MNPEMNNWLQLILRWAHVVAGVIWIGHLYFFNFVNAHFAKLLDGPTKKSVVPELMPRALYWFRWGAAWTWITGILLGGLIYYHGKQAFDQDYQSQNPWLWLGVVLVILALGFVIYSAIMRSVKNVVVASIIAMVVFAAAYFVLEFVGHFGGRSLYIHAGLMFGTIMAMNVWMVIWPAQQKIIRAVKEGTAPDANLVAQAGLRSRQNTYMSVPLIFFMISNHFAPVFSNTERLLGIPVRDWCAAGIIALGFAATRMLFAKSAKVTGF
jgi:uncharacterized membrane protein